MKSVIKASLLTLIVLAPAPRAFAQYNFSSWKADDGLPQNSVYAILQTRDGYLWFTTLDGVVRFDGVSFTSFSKSNTRNLKSNRFSSLLEDARGDLWIGTDDGGVARYHAGEFFSYTTQDGLPHNAIDGLLKDRDGLALVVTRSGMVRWNGDRFVGVSLPASVAYNHSNGAITTAGGGVFWYAGRDAIQNFSESQLISSQNYHGLSVDCIFEDSQHNVWLGTVGSGLVRFKDGGLTTYGVKDGLPSPNVTALFEDRDHNLWIGTRAGLCLFKDGRFTTYYKD